jgi:hypothetical protein
VIRLDEYLHATCCARHATESIILKTFGVDVTKALDPMKDADYLKIVDTVRAALLQATAKTETEIVTRAFQTLDVDWGRLTKDQRDKVLGAYAEALRPLPERIPPQANVVFEAKAPPIVKASKKSQAKSAKVTARVSSNFSAVDQKMIKHLSAQSHYVTNVYGQRIDSYSRTARTIVTDSLSAGLGRDDIATDLERALGPAANLGRASDYWDVIAGVFSNRSRMWGSVSAFKEAGIERYVFEAVLDEVTTDQCAALHGRTFETDRAAKLFDQASKAEDPEAVKDIMPWIRIGKGEDGGRIMFVEYRDGRREKIADVLQSRVGKIDAVPTLANMRSTGDLAEMGLVTPPLHARCRSTIVPDI